MTKHQFRQIIAHLGLSQRDAARFLDISDRQVRRIAAGKVAVPKAVAMLLLLMISAGFTPAYAEWLASGSKRQAKIAAQISTAPMKRESATSSVTA